MVAGQERGLRPGTLPVALIAAFLVRPAPQHLVMLMPAQRDAGKSVNISLMRFEPLGAVINGSSDQGLIANLETSVFQGLNSEAVMLVLKEI